MASQRDIEIAILQRDVDALAALMFEGSPPSVRPSFRTETQLWDFKRDCPRLGKDHENAWAHFAADVLSFHNQNGGVIICGIDDDFRFSGATTRLDSKQLNDQLRKYLGDRIWVDYYRIAIQSDQRYLGVAVVPSRGAVLERFRQPSPIVGGERMFNAGDSALREGDSSRVLSKREADELALKVSAPRIGQAYEIDEPMYRVLWPDYSQFVERRGPCDAVENALVNPRTAVTSIVGIGGAGKTALATWAVLRS